MTVQKSFKRLVRSRMEKTGESYAAARASLPVAGLAGEGGVDDVTGGLLLGSALWTGFPLVLWVGAIVREKTPVKPAAIHAGDWLVKLPAVGVLLSVAG